MADTLQVTVTSQHIRTGKRQKACSCPIAHAVFDVTGSVPYVTNYLYVDGVQYELPKSALDFIKLFDYGVMPEPFTFTATKTAKQTTPFQESVKPVSQ